MGLTNMLLGTPNRRIAGIALAVFALDQFTKFLVLRWLGSGSSGWSVTPSRRVAKSARLPQAPHARRTDCLWDCLP